MCLVDLSAGDAARDVGAVTVGLAAGHSNIRPGPAWARIASAGNDDVIPAAWDRTGSRNIFNRKVGDRDPARRGTAVKVASIVVLLDEDAVPTGEVNTSRFLHIKYCDRPTYLEMDERVIPVYVTPLMVPVSPSVALMRIPFGY